MYLKDFYRTIYKFKFSLQIRELIEERYVFDYQSVVAEQFIVEAPFFIQKIKKYLDA